MTAVELEADETREDARGGGAAGVAGLWAYLTGHGLSPLVVAVAVVAMLAPVMLVEYAVGDDAALLWMAVSGEPTPQFGESLIEMNAAGGRLINGVALEGSLSLAGSVDGLRFLRAVGVAGVVVLGLLMHWGLIRAGLRPSVAALIAVFVASMPGMQVFASWAVLWVAAYGAVLAGVASMVTAGAAERPWRGEVARYALAGALLLAALLMYQPAAMFFWVFLAIALVGAVGEPERAWRLARAHLGVAAVTLGVAYVVLRLTVLYVGEDAPGAARSALAWDVAGRLRWFAEQPLYQALNLFDYTPTQWGAALTVAVAGGGIVLWLVLNVRRWWLFVLLGVALVPLSYLPNLVVTDTWPPFRTQSALVALLALYVGLGAVGVWLVVGPRLAGRLNAGEFRLARGAAWTGLVGLVAVSGLAAASNVTNVGVLPLNAELRMLRGQVRTLPSEPGRVTMVYTDWYGGMVAQPGYDEMGLPFSARAWGPEPMIQLMLREDGRLTSTYGGPAVDYYLSGSTRFPPGQPVLDLRGLRGLR